MIMKGTPLEELINPHIEQTVIFYNNETGHTIVYNIKKGSLGYFCNHSTENNDLIFKHLQIEKQNFQEKLLDYREEGQFPYCHSLKDLGIMLQELWKLYYQNMLKSLDFTTLSTWPKTLKLMCEMQMKQGNPVNPTVFLKKFIANKKEGGFDWPETPYEDLFITMNLKSKSEDRDRLLKEFINRKSEPIEKQNTLTIKTKHHAIKLQDKKASVRRGNLPEGSRKRGRESKAAVVCGHIRNRICHS